MCACKQVVCPRYNSLYTSLRHDLQLTCLVLTVVIYSCSLAVITWPAGAPADCRRVTSRYSNTDGVRVAWTGRSFDDDNSHSSSSSSSSSCCCCSFVAFIGKYICFTLMVTVSITKTLKLASSYSRCRRCRSSSSSSSSSHINGDTVTSVQTQKCQHSEHTSSGNIVSTLTLTWSSLIVVIYLVYIAECWFSPYRRRFSNRQRRVVDTQAAYHLVTSLRNSLPVVRWTAVSYHYIRSAVASVSATTPLRHHKPYKQRIVTSRNTTLYHYAPGDLVDCSPPLVDLESFPVTWLRISCQFSFGSTTARRDFRGQRDAFYRSNRTRDQHVDFRQTLSLLATSGATLAWTRDMAICNPDVRPWYTSVVAYWVASLLTLSWPLRVVLQWRTATVEYSVHKVFDYRAANGDDMSRGYDDVISVTSLENSDSSSSNSTTNSQSISSDSGSMVVDMCLVPSYSQALLMDTRTADNHKTAHHFDNHQQQQQCQQCRLCQHKCQQCQQCRQCQHKGQQCQQCQQCPMCQLCQHKCQHQCQWCQQCRLCQHTCQHKCKQCQQYRQCQHKCQQCHQWRRGCCSSRLRRVQSCLTVHRDVTRDIKPSTSLTTHLYKSTARPNRAAILMTSRPPSYDTAMCLAAHVTTHRLTPCGNDGGYDGAVDDSVKNAHSEQLTNTWWPPFYVIIAVMDIFLLNVDSSQCNWQIFHNFNRRIRIPRSARFVYLTQDPISLSESWYNRLVDITQHIRLFPKGQIAFAVKIRNSFDVICSVHINLHLHYIT